MSSRGGKYLLGVSQSRTILLPRCENPAWKNVVATASSPGRTLCYSASHGSSQLWAPLATEDCGTQSRHYTDVGSGSSGSVGGTGCKRRRTPLCPVVAVSLHKIYPVIPADLLSTVSTSTCPGWPSLLLPFLVLRCPVRSYLYSSPRLHVLLTLLYFTMTIVSRFGLQLLFGSLLCN